MTTPDKFFSEPALAAILQALLLAPSGLSEENLLAPYPEAEGQKALDTLASHGLISRTGGLWTASTDPNALAKITRIIDAFREIEDITRASLLTRGILNATAYFRCLIHRGTVISMLGTLGIDAARAEKVLLLEEKQGYIEHHSITYRSRGTVREKFFPFVPYHHYDDFANTNGRLVEAVAGEPPSPGAPLSLSQEDYLLGTYPESLAEQGRQYLESRDKALLERIQTEAFDIIWYYDRY